MLLDRCGDICHSALFLARFINKMNIEWRIVESEWADTYTYVHTYTHTRARAIQPWTLPEARFDHEFSVRSGRARSPAGGFSSLLFYFASHLWPLPVPHSRDDGGAFGVRVLIPYFRLPRVPFAASAIAERRPWKPRLLRALTMISGTAVGGMIGRNRARWYGRLVDCVPARALFYSSYSRQHYLTGPCIRSIPRAFN